MCSGPERVAARYDIPATHLHWLHAPQRPRRRPVAGIVSAGRIAAGILIDAWRTAAWVGRHDAVIVPGMGVLEATQVNRPWQDPYSMFLVTLCGRLFRTKVALVGVGASSIPSRSSRWLLTAAVRQASYLSYRDDYSRRAMHSMGVVRRSEPIFPDLVFSLPVPSDAAVTPGSVAVGVMAYWGTSADGRRGRTLHDGYVVAMKEFVRWLLDEGHSVRILIGDHDDEPEAREILADAERHWTKAGQAPIDFEPVSSTTAVMQVIASVEIVVAARFHNVLMALACGRPTLAIAYGEKHRALMAQMGSEDFCHSIRDIDPDLLREQFRSLRATSAQLSATLRNRAELQRQRLDSQFSELMRALFPSYPAVVSVGRPEAAAE
jgi:polysaccharide pyruvyl transferase WcaK-like protein